MSDIFLQVFLALLGIVVGILAALVEKRWLKWMLLIFSLLLFLCAGLWWVYSLPTNGIIPTPVPSSSEKPQTLHTNIEVLPMTTQTLSGTNIPSFGNSNMTLTKHIAQSGLPEYTFDYSLPNTDGLIIFTFNFDSTTDLSMYTFVEVTIDFFDENRGLNLYFHDTPTGKNKSPEISLGTNMSNSEIRIYKNSNTNLTYHIPLAAFKNLNVHEVDIIGFYMTSCMYQGNGKFMVTNFWFGAP